MVKKVSDVAEKWKTRYCQFSGMTKSEAEGVSKGELADKCGDKVEDAYEAWV